MFFLNYCNKCIRKIVFTTTEIVDQMTQLKISNFKLNILDNSINDLKGLQVHPNKGHPFIYLSYNVMSGRQSTKRKNNCSIYNSKGHNAKNYDKKIAQLSFTIINKQDLFYSILLST